MAGVKPNVIILGGCGFIGRHLVEYLVSENLANKIRVVDKVPPAVAWLNSTHTAAFNSDNVEFRSANLINSSSCELAFEECEDGGGWDYCVNLACEMKLTQMDIVYKEGIVRLGVNAAKQAAKSRVKRYIEISSGQIYHGHSPSNESSKTHPWTCHAKFKLQLEDELKKISDLNYVTLRPAIVYGTGDKSNLTPRLVIGGVYKHLGEGMKLMWTKDLKMNTVHVADLCACIVYMFTHGKSGDVYNVVDEGDTTQGTISAHISQIFDINHDYWGKPLSEVAKLNMEDVCEDINDKHMGPWAALCAGDGIANTPLNPYISPELLYKHHTCLDGKKLRKTGFTLKHPTLTKLSLQEMLSDYVDMKLFPSSLLS